MIDLGEGKYLIPGPSSLPVSPKSLLHTVPPMLKLAIIPEIRTRNKQTKLQNQIIKRKMFKSCPEKSIHVPGSFIIKI